jgi:hypothetical protein
MEHTRAIDTLTRAGRYLMDQRDIWYDRVPNDHGDMVTGPHYQAVTLLFTLASDLRKAA